MWKNLEEKRLYELWNEFVMLADGTEFLEKENKKYKSEIGRLKCRITRLEIELANEVEYPEECEILKENISGEYFRV
jgi:hypothetical protein